MTDSRRKAVDERTIDISNHSNLFLDLKHKLPFNGDWLFVTATPYDGPQDGEGSQPAHDRPDAILRRIKSNDIDVVKLAYERAKAHESAVYETANHVYDKAKALLSSGSFVSAVLLGVVSLLLTALSRLTGWIVGVELLALILMTSHLMRSLYIAMQVMTREESVRTSPEEFLSPLSASKSSVTRAYKQAISEVVAYSNQTRDLTRKRVNRLILGQHAFRNGLLWFVLFVVVHLGAVTLADKVTPKDSAQQMAELEARLSSIASRQDQQATAIAALVDDVSILRKETESLIEQLRQPKEASTKKAKVRSKWK